MKANLNQSDSARTVRGRNFSSRAVLCAIFIIAIGVLPGTVFSAIAGAQFRDDYPNKDDAFGKVNTIVSKASDGSMHVRLEPLPEMPDYLKQVIEENR